MKIMISLPLLIIFLFLFIGCASRESKKNENIIPVKVVKLRKEKVRKVVYVSGVFATNDETYLSFKTGGIIKSIFVSEGDKVKKGQLLAALELNEIQARVSQAKSGYEKALRDYKRAQNLYKDSVATLEQMQDAKTGLDIAAEQLKIAKYNLNHSEIRATKDGYILKKLVNEGQLVGSGKPIFQTNGAGQDNWILKAGISDHDWSLVKVGDKAIVQSDVDPSNNLDAYVVHKSEAEYPGSGAFLVELKIKKNSSEKIATGLFGKAEIYPALNLKMWVAPYQSILDAKGDKSFVFVTNNLKTAKRVKANIFELNKDSVYINGGLDNFKYLIVSGSAYLSNNSRIKIDN